MTGSPDAPSPLADAFVETKLAPQMLPAEVAVVLGRPSYGVETPAGNVRLFYPQLGIEVEYAAGALVLWRQIVTYENGPAKTED